MLSVTDECRGRDGDTAQCRKLHPVPHEDAFRPDDVVHPDSPTVAQQDQQREPSVRRRAGRGTMAAVKFEGHDGPRSESWAPPYVECGFDQLSLRNFLPKNSTATNTATTTAPTTAAVRISSRDRPKS
jgi:hypothetical protein